MDAADGARSATAPCSALPGLETPKCKRADEKFSSGGAMKVSDIRIRAGWAGMCWRAHQVELAKAQALVKDSFEGIYPGFAVSVNQSLGEQTIASYVVQKLYSNEHPEQPKGREDTEGGCGN
jgi:hypothetical protein